MLSIVEVTKTYPNGVKALKGVTLTVQNGLFGLLGPNGAGKSTLMRTLATLQEPDSGRILLDGQGYANRMRGTRGRDRGPQRPGSHRPHRTRRRRPGRPPRSASGAVSGRA